MITRKELLKRLKEDIRTEEVAVSLYTRHLKDTLHLAGISDEQRQRMTALLDRLTEDSKTHERVMKELLSTISASDRDVY
ncbi:hypothetical protein [Prosthecochloris sp. HL-130-GSB]|jgi:rubrerythrin|uniref:Rubrerythrin diiron-binding domain-containing protein n=1 Tax=Prosthecochloris aestuarii TaxID=1102 RepID=A0A831ST78_PROAE|nr:hypothetical protein [Prosthecochloris sp. HL-130-GSB]ARM30848.1 hypothetical protein B9H02_05430 [Prosthecochloris sp. HL-130-GSB]MBO8093693.1 hypothetical protein [Prosthecochloris sp.]HED31307.1 hypothetical protein [Prosthecochloris aestuarii]